jgi:hypothetical protein
MNRVVLSWHVREIDINNKRRTPPHKQFSLLSKNYLRKLETSYINLPNIDLPEKPIKKVVHFVSQGVVDRVYLHRPAPQV